MKEEIKPISPDDIVDNLENIIPSVVIQAVNSLLKDNYRGTGSVTIKQDEIINKIIGLDGSLTRQVIFEKKYLDFEELYTKNGWVVIYDKPAYNESYDAYFKFNKKK
jgi:hypothetical protein